MNMTIVYCFVFISFAMCMGAVAWLASKGIGGWGWILFCSILFFGSINVRHDDIAECPDCHKVFKVEQAHGEED